MSATEGRGAGKQRTRPAPGRRSPLLARLAALLVIFVYAAGLSVTVWLERRIGLQGENSMEDAVLFVGFGMFAAVGAMLVAKRPENPIGWIMGAVALMVGFFPALETYAAYVMTTSGEPNALAVVGAWANSWYWFLLLALVFVYLPLLFPDGRLLSRRWLPVAVLPGIGVVVMVVLGALSDTLRGQTFDYRIDNPIGIEGLAPVEDLPVFGATGVLLGVGAVGAFASVVVRFWRSRGIERQQMKWFAYAAVPVLIVPLSFFVLPWIVDALAFGWVLIGLPAAIGIAVLRYRLYGIDVVINRTLVYAALTASLALVYFGGIAVLQGLFRALTGEGSTLAVVASTLLIAALFNPLRRRVQAFIDRCFYRKKYDAQETLSVFGARLRDEVDLETLSEDLVGVVRETMEPEHASLWLRPVTGRTVIRGKREYER